MDTFQNKIIVTCFIILITTYLFFIPLISKVIFLFSSFICLKYKSSLSIYGIKEFVFSPTFGEILLHGACNTKSSTWKIYAQREILKFCGKYFNNYIKFFSIQNDEILFLKNSCFMQMFYLINFIFESLTLGNVIVFLFWKFFFKKFFLFRPIIPLYVYEYKQITDKKGTNGNMYNKSKCYEDVIVLKIVYVIIFLNSTWHLMHKFAGQPWNELGFLKFLVLKKHISTKVKSENKKKTWCI